MLVVNSDSEIRTFKEHIETANSRPDGLNHATTGVGSLAHANFAALSGEVGMKTSDVPFTGNAPAINALLGNNIDSVVIQSIDALPKVPGLKDVEHRVDADCGPAGRIRHVRAEQFVLRCAAHAGNRLDRLPVTKIGLPITPMLIGVVLGGMVEEEFRRSLIMSSGDHMIFLARPISPVLVIVLVAFMSWKAAAAQRRRSLARKVVVAPAEDTKVDT